MSATVKLRGEGGVVWDFDLPLNEVFENQVKTRKLVPADDDSFDLVKHLLVEETDGPAETPAAEPAGNEGSRDLDALGKMKLAELITLAGDAGVADETLASFAKTGTSKKSVIEAIVAADAATEA